MYCISVSHKKAPVNIRERFAFQKEEGLEFICQLKKNPDITGCVLLSTCNRTEWYITGTKQAIPGVWEELIRVKQIPKEDIGCYLNLYSGEKAIRHLFKVCCGFDSMVIGEDEILGQVKDAYQNSLKVKASDSELNLLFHKALTCAKRIKTCTRLSKTPLSIATLAANHVFRFEKMQKKQVMIMGITGKMGHTIAKNLLSKSNIQITGTIREHPTDAMLRISDERIRLIDYKDRYNFIKEMDIIISATTSPHYTITVKQLTQRLTDGKKRQFLDLAVPLDIDPLIQSISGVSCYNMDYFESMAHHNSEIKMKEFELANTIMEEEFDDAVKSILFHPYINKITKYQEIFAGEKLDTLMFRIRDHVTSEELKVILKTLDQLEDWIKED